MTGFMPMLSPPIPTVCGGIGASTIRGAGILLGIIIAGIMEVGIRIIITHIGILTITTIIIRTMHGAV